MDDSLRRVSIVIPAHNEERQLRSCLDAIAAQTVQPFEVIVADNNSRDKTAEVAARYDFVRVVKESKQGRVFARNAGFRAARGDIIARIDADIVLPPEWIEHVTAFYTDTRNEFRAWTGAGHFYNVHMPRLVSFGYSLMAFRFNKLLLGHYSLWGSNMALPRTLWQAVQGEVCLRNDLHEDLDLAMHLAAKGFVITYDTSAETRVNAELRRVHSNRHELWEYLNWWPRALKLHGNSFWPLAWFFGVLGLYLATLVLVLAEKVFGKAASNNAEAESSSAAASDLDPTD